jgi:hypothetical protein
MIAAILEQINRDPDRNCGATFGSTAAQCG